MPALDFNQRLAALVAHYNEGMSLSSIAGLTKAPIEEIEELMVIGKDYLTDPLPRRRARRDDAPAETRTTRARTRREDTGEASEREEAAGSGTPLGAVAQKAPGI
jgi:hypothetical protein